MVHHALALHLADIIEDAALFHNILKVVILVHTVYVAEIGIPQIARAQHLVKRTLHNVQFAPEAVYVVFVHRAEVHLRVDFVAPALHNASERLVYVGAAATKIEEIHAVLHGIAQNRFNLPVLRRVNVSEPKPDLADLLRAVRQLTILHKFSSLYPVFGKSLHRQPSRSL